MQLTVEQLRSIALGAVRIVKEGGCPRFFRFTQAEEALYIARDAERGSISYDHSLCTAGVKLLFKTNSKTLGLSAEVARRITRSFFAFDVCVNGNYIGSLSNFSAESMPAGYSLAEIPLPLGRHKKEFMLGEGEKTVAIYFPWSVEVLDFALTIEDGAKWTPVKPAKKLLVYGDSITQGHDAMYPKNRYPARLAEALGAEEINKAIGAEVFFPALAACAADFVPDVITVAYGTNDWFTTDAASFLAAARGFFEMLVKNYPEAKIFAISPIYRKDMNESKTFGAVSTVIDRLREATAALPAVTVIDGMNLVPAKHTLYADLRLHPSDAGFDHFSENLIAEIKKHL